VGSKKTGPAFLMVAAMWKKFRVALGAVSITALAACAVPPNDYYANPDDYRASSNYRGDPDDYRAYPRAPDDNYGNVRDRSYRDPYGDRDGDGVLNWRDRCPDDPRRF
jgi:hypothetical protein